MPRSGGVYSPTSGIPVTSGSIANSAEFNALVDDLGDEITNSVARDGSGPPTANTPWDNHKITNLADATAATDAMNRQASDARYLALGGGTLTGGLSGTTATLSGAVTAASTALSGALTAASAALSGTATVNGGTTVGYLEIPQNSQSGNYTLVLTDAAKHIIHPSGGGAGDTITIPANASVAFPVGTVVTFANADSNNVSIAITSDTMTLAGTTLTGTRTLGQNSVACALKVTSTAWIISGAGLS